MKLPWLPPGRVLALADRGEIFYRHHVNPDSTRPTLLLLHGWTASADTQWFTAYRELAEAYSFIAVDHRGHGRGMRSPFTLVDAADDAALLVRALGVGPVVLVGYSMGGPISMLLTNRHPDLVAGVVLEATALEWRATRRERLTWRALAVMGVWLRSRWYLHGLRVGLRRLGRVHEDLEQWFPWLEGEIRRNDVHGVLEAGRELATYDARPFASSLGKPTAMLLTTQDRLVKPRKQRALATATGAVIVELHGDHLCSLVQPTEFSATTRRLVDDVVSRLPAPSGAPH
ncbi:MAG: alpha/beta fold hydrolase [Acidimicrobiia bacterium]